MRAEVGVHREIDNQRRMRAARPRLGRIFQFLQFLVEVSEVALRVFLERLIGTLVGALPVLFVVCSVVLMNIIL